MSDLVEFLTARLDEDAEIATAAAHGRDGRWRIGPYNAPNVEINDQDPDDGAFQTMVVFDEGSPSSEQAMHIAHVDPARMRAEVEAKRQIIARAIRLQEGQQLGMRYVWQDVKDLASVYADHPDYRQEWKL